MVAKKNKKLLSFGLLCIGSILMMMLLFRGNEKGRMLKEKEIVPDWARDMDDPIKIESKERRIKLNIIVLTVTVLVIISQAFEIGKEKLLEYTSEDMLPIIESLFGELTLLGFIGVSLFLVFQMKWIHNISEALYGEATAIDELGEAVHMVLFLVMVLFLMQALAMARMGEASRKKWLQWESRKTGHMSAIVEKSAIQFLEASWFDLVMVQTYPNGLRALLYAATRESLLRQSNFDENVFDFAHYLSVALGRTLAELVEVPVRTWLGLEVGLLAFFLLDYLMSNKMRIFLWTLIAYAALAAAFIVHGKIRFVLRHHLKNQIQLALDQAHADDEEEDALKNDKEEEDALKSTFETTTQLPPPLPEEDQIKNVDKLSPRQQGKKPPYAQMPRSASIKMARLQRIKAKQKQDHPPISQSYLDKLQSFVVPYTNKIYHFFQQNQNMIQIRRKIYKFMTIALEKAHDVWKKYIIGVNQYEQINNTKDDDQNGEYVSLFWLGNQYKAAFTLDIIRVIPLFMSIYLAVFTLVYVPWIFRLCHGFGAHLGAIILLIVSYLPAISLQAKLPNVMEDFAIIAHIAEMINLRFVEQVLSHQKTIAAFQALRVVACLRHPKLLTTIMKNTQTTPISNQETINDCDFIDKIIDDCENDQALEKLIAADSEERRRRLSWANTFSLFDEYHRGVLNREELSDMLLKFADDQDESRGHVQEIVAMLDADDSGEISFDEFYDFGKKLEQYYATTGNSKQLIHEIFHMIDRDHGGTITIEELHQTIQSIGLDLSLNVVYNLVKDIDEDGNGALDKHEFEILMYRVDQSAT
mmetsp:Transcript_11262/g.15461  ORF Transcript_11262/g.15461 Transcript_11262/m.15461 type:complete len:812 (-) Transcript_11262:372-2807(-)|eukprot:CAMPEP_0197313918 /NCGR_PEP_ID=MMETSP0891-20130614/31101_1 /TAXON_ID=44058 ORGANISM="Aureoumbra lagunensis, Strain CCMP1510" /NCGR_SAMPLE_ID=MMETSP0891 /ASSEMBLY_ACC=CAM_ASM_000534 /LENGTH=811 /DNA_ID=CAMNT_0042802087 /DNA_START=27 /DNA_END=2462 /DNA_ORIENTATION=+